MPQTKIAANLVNGANGNPESLDAKACPYKGNKSIRLFQAASDYRQAVERNYLREFFKTYPGRMVCKHELLSALRHICRNMSAVSRMIRAALRNGTLEASGKGVTAFSSGKVVKLYTLKSDDHE